MSAPVTEPMLSVATIVEAVGAVVSPVTAKAEDALLVLPAVSVSLVVNEYTVPSATVAV